MNYSKILSFFILSLFLFACAARDRSSAREVKKETREKRKAPIVLSAKDGNYYFNLRQNNFFEYYGVTLGVTKADLYAGSYEMKGDSLLLAFQNNYKPADLTGTGFIDRTNNQVVLISKDTSQNRKLGILLGENK
jgi:hypothetical protein